MYVRPQYHHPPIFVLVFGLFQAAAYDRGMADRGRQAEAEAAQLQEAAEKALEEVKQGARTTIEEMANRRSEELDMERK